jgi:hypothetical protein
MLRLRHQTNRSKKESRVGQHIIKRNDPSRVSTSGRFSLNIVRGNGWWPGTVDRNLGRGREGLAVLPDFLFLPISRNASEGRGLR